MKPVSATRFSILQLEDRTVPAVVAGLVNDTLTVSGSATSFGDTVRIENSFGPVRVFDGNKLVGSFASVRVIDVRSDGNLKLDVGLDHARPMDALNVKLGRGINEVRISGSIGKTALAGTDGQDNIRVAALTGAVLEANTGFNKDQVVLARSNVEVVSVQAAEFVNVASGEYGMVNMANYDSTASINSAASIARQLTVFSRGGSFNLAGTVAGNVLYTGGRAFAGNALKFSGTILGNLQMVGTDFADSARLDPGSVIAGNVDLELGAGPDQVVIAGSVGSDDQVKSLNVNTGTDNDSFALENTGRILSIKTYIWLGSGHDRATVGDSAYFEWLNLVGSAGNDTFIGDRTNPRLNLVEFEVVV